jgi:transposase
MGRKVKRLKNYTAEQIETLFESDENNIAGVKMYAVLQLTRGCSARKLEEFYRVTHKQICNRADRFDTEGIAGLRIKPGRGRRASLTSHQHEPVKAGLQQSSEKFGCNTANQSGPLLRRRLDTGYQVFYRQAAVYVLLHEPCFSFQRTRGKYPKRKLHEEAKVDIKKL